MAAPRIAHRDWYPLGAMGAFVNRAHDSGSCILVVTRSSNPEGRVIQAAVGEGGVSVEAAVLAEIVHRVAV